MKKILITGASGQLGNSLKKLFSSKYDLIPTHNINSHKRNNFSLDISNSLMTKDLISAISPDVIINLAALTNVDSCESNPRLAHGINFQGVKNLINTFKGSIIHISTDYVFDGKLGQYKEGDIPNPINVYGFTKLEAEKLLFKKSKKSLIIRTNVLYDYQKKSKASFLNWVVDSLRKGEKIKVVDDQFNNPTWTNSIAVVIERAIEEDLNGLIHWGDFDWISRYDFANKIADKFNLQSNLIEPIKTDELNQIAPRPLKGGLNTTLAQSLLRLEPPKIDDCLNQIIENLE